ncbi:MAG TPA: ribosome maturation factor RimP [Actinomycetota bacterium]
MDAEALVRPVVEGAGLELVDVTWSGRGRSPLLRITVDRDGGVDLDTISSVSEQVSRRLDLEGFEPGRPYQLEVTTPGLERPLRRPQDFRRAVGQRVRVRTDEGTIEGELRDVDDEVLKIAVSEGERPVHLTEIAAARTVVDWDQELKGSGR